MTIVLVVGVLSSMYFVQPVKATETIYIRADGSIDPPTAPIQRNVDLYTFTDDINDSIVVEKNDAVIDGNGYILQGDGTGNGFLISGRSNVTVKKVVIREFDYGVRLNYSSGVNIIHNSITNNDGNGLYAYRSSSNVVDQNNITDNGWNGVAFSYSSFNNVTANNVARNYGNGIYVGGDWSELSSQNIIAKNSIATNRLVGINIVYSGQNSITENYVTGHTTVLSGWNIQPGVMVDRTNNNSLTGNTVANNFLGIFLYSAYDNILKNNSLSGNQYHFRISYGYLVSEYINDVDSSNRVDDKPIYYWIGKQNASIPIDAGCVILVNSRNITAQNLSMKNNYDGILLAFTENTTIADNSIVNSYGGIHSRYSSNNSITTNHLQNNSNTGISLYCGAHNVVNQNDVTGSGCGIELKGTSDVSTSFNNITGNHLEKNAHGIYLSARASRNNIIANNIVRGTYWGITLDDSSSYNNITANYITKYNIGIFGLGNGGDNIVSNIIKDNYEGIAFGWTGTMKIYHNDFISNTRQVDLGGYGTIITWNDTYPSGGNYWSDYTDTDQYSGPYQNITGSDGIGDGPHILNANNKDWYPFMNRLNPIHNVAIMNAVPSKSVVGQDYNLNLNVTTANQGDFTETFNVTTYANSTVIHTQTVILESNTSATIAFTWNTTGFAYGNYTISAEVTPVLGEADTSDNTYTFGVVKVTIPGDVDGDFYVNILDVVKITALYMYKTSDPGYDPNKDIDGNGVINILDVVICTSHYGEKYP